MMTDQQPVIKWGALRPLDGGPRHYAGSDAQSKAPWRCVRCGEENQGELGQGCTSCGSGGGAKHVGVDPIVVRRKRSEIEEETRERPVRTESPKVTTVATPDHTLIVDQGASLAFVQWMQTQEKPTLVGAFMAGWFEQQARRVGGGAQPPNEEEEEPVALLPETEAALALLGTARSRTLLAALIYFRDQVLQGEPEEIQTGEWLSGEEVQTWIAALQAEESTEPQKEQE